jgi:hypothetical protein
MLVEGTPAELRRPLEGRMIEVTGALPERIASWVAAVDGIEEKQIFGATLRLRVPSGAAETITLAVEDLVRQAGGSAVHARQVSPSLEDVFRFLLTTASGGDGR